MLMKHPNPSILAYIGMADAYAAPAESIVPPAHQRVVDDCLAFVRYVRHPAASRARVGCYADATEMSVANARTLLAAKPPYARWQFADAWIQECHHVGVRPGYQSGFRLLLRTVSSGSDLINRVDNVSDKNDAAARAVPFGVLPTVEQVLDAATTQARVTHNTPEGLFSARAVALMSHYALYQSGPLADLSAFCCNHLPSVDMQMFDWVFEGVWDGRVVGSAGMPLAVTTVSAVVNLLTTQASLKAMMERLLRWGGDTGPVAAITWGIASARFQNERLPDFLSRDLEGGNPLTGTPHLLHLGAELMAKYALEAQPVAKYA
jgi:ADP-ribosylglycohydrolase